MVRSSLWYPFCRSLPPDDVARPQMVGDAARHLDQEVVAGAVPQAVVDELETVEVDEHHRVGVVFQTAAFPQIRKNGVFIASLLNCPGQLRRARPGRL